MRAAAAGIALVLLQLTPPPSKRMADGKQWTAANLDVAATGSYCYDDAESNCRRYGRLYTWASAQEACRGRGPAGRRPRDEWRQLAKHHGGVSADSADRGRPAYDALLLGGSSGFEALLGGGREPGDGKYARLEAHGFYWTASEKDASNAVFYNFGKGGRALHRQDAGEKESAFTVRCVRD
jgi:uncharacterized protein (TIGR02145 family)